MKLALTVTLLTDTCLECLEGDEFFLTEEAEHYYISPLPRSHIYGVSLLCQTLGL